MEPINLKETVNLPKTDFPIRAGLAQVEPELLTQWTQSGVVDSIHLDSSDRPTFVLHDGPPYPNGNIHLGHALNKVLKDIIGRARRMAGFKTRLIPGWDCHGLPIETQVIKELKAAGDEHKKNDIAWFRNRCKEFALAHVATQKEQFKRLGIWADWDHPYLTLTPGYEAQVIRLFGDMAANGVIYKGKKPIHWCMHCETALAEAEIEYANHKSPSIFVTFRVAAPSAGLADQLGEKPVDILVWTTTPWTLPANVALAAHPDYDYLVLETSDRHLVVAASLADRLTALLDVSVINSRRISGQDLDGTITDHPLLHRSSPVVMADYVTQDDGTGIVHIAPGHGQDDYVVGLKYNLPTIMPVDNHGRFTSEVPWAGERVFDANKSIGQALDAAGKLLKLQWINHSYPHCWRCKQPVIFRATAQWFVAMDRPMAHTKSTLREGALAAIEAVQWIPAWGKNRITSMIGNRPDWCISRQRFWGIPIPVFNCTACGHSEMTGLFNQAVVDLVAAEGTLAWFERSADEILPKSCHCSQCGGGTFAKETDILDVWFESGASFAGVLEPHHEWPADLYLEGSDQHRGWFHSSLLIGIAARGRAPYTAVLTHGFLVDDKGRKMSKSVGNVVAPEQVIRDFGADILRWWVANSDFKNDIGVAVSILNQHRDTYSKVRNTIRFCLSNLYDFDPVDHAVEVGNLHEIDRWALAELAMVSDDCRRCYDTVDLHTLAHRLHDFCAVTLSALYLDMTKDRLYCDAPQSPTRRSTQTVLHAVADALIRWMAPITPFMAEDAYRYFTKVGKRQSVHLELFPSDYDHWKDDALTQKWSELLTLKEAVYQQLEPLRKDKVVKSFLEAKVKILSPNPRPDADLEAIFIVSAVDWVTRPGDLEIHASVADGDKCERCWKILPLRNAVCHRCYDAVFGCMVPH